MINKNRCLKCGYYNSEKDKCKLLECYKEKNRIERKRRKIEKNALRGLNKIANKIINKKENL